ncbi:MAG TPA: VanZ family protein [Steroidobacteraceae bacterium]|nr:VanZ family protein [Steroidobacteraceae bacterium]
MSEAALRRAWIAAILVLVALIVAGSLSPKALVPNESLSDKTGHFLAYLSLALLGSGIATPSGLWRTMLRCFLLGASLELAQALLTENRMADVADLAANAAGILTAWLIAGQGRAGWGLRAAAWLGGRRSS